MFKKFLFLSLLTTVSAAFASNYGYTNKPPINQPVTVTTVTHTTAHQNAQNSVDAMFPKPKRTTGEKIVDGVVAVGLTCCYVALIACMIKHPELFAPRYVAYTTYVPVITYYPVTPFFGYY